MELLTWRIAGRVTAVATVLAVIFVAGMTHAQDAEDYFGSEQAKQAPPIIQVAGLWTGTDSNSDGGSGTGSGPMSLDLSQNKKQLTGTFNVTTGDQTPDGTVKGKINNDVLDLTFYATGGSRGNCKAKAIATVDGDTMSGTYVVTGGQHCKGRGTFDLQRQ